MYGEQTNVSYFSNCQKLVGLIGLWFLDTGPRSFKEELSCWRGMLIADILMCMVSMQLGVRRDISLLIDSVTHYANG